jgi:hypothetical protein
MNQEPTTQIREIDRRNNVPKEDFDMDIDKFCRRVYSVFPTVDEQPDKDILAMCVTFCTTRLILGKIARLCEYQLRLQDTDFGFVYQLNLELGDQKVVVYAK